MTTETDGDGVWEVTEQPSGVKVRMLVTPSQAWKDRQAAIPPIVTPESRINWLVRVLKKKGILVEGDEGL